MNSKKKDNILVYLPKELDTVKVELHYDRPYQYGNYVLFNNEEIMRVDGISKDLLDLTDENGTVYSLPYSKISGLPLSREIMKKFKVGATSIETKLLHTKIIYDISINGKIYRFFGHQYKDKHIWSFKDITIHYMHEFQNLLSLIEPRYKLKLF